MQVSVHNIEDSFYRYHNHVGAVCHPAILPGFPLNHLGCHTVKRVSFSARVVCLIQFIYVLITERVSFQRFFFFFFSFFFFFINLAIKCPFVQISGLGMYVAIANVCMSLKLTVKTAYQNLVNTKALIRLYLLSEHQ